MKARKRTPSAKSIKPSTVRLYAGGFAVLVALVAIGYRAPETSTTAANVGDASSANATSVDEVVATNIAAGVAAAANLPVATNASNLSVSTAAKSEMAQVDDTTLSKPSIVQPDADRLAVITHTVEQGDDVNTLSAEYGVSKDTIKWANDLTSDALKPGEKLKILPVDGVLYTVGGSDTITSIADSYGASAERIVAFNSLELSGVEEGAELIIPAGELPEEERPGYEEPQSLFGSTAPVQNTGASIASSGNSFSSASVGNRYAYGYCTWYAYERRAELGRPIGSFWGNANTWAAAAGGSGFAVNNEPAVGAVFQTAAGGGGYGHVGIIESIDHARGTLTYSDMNGGAGWNRVGTGTVSISQAKAQWMFIH